MPENENNPDPTPIAQESTKIIIEILGDSNSPATRFASGIVDFIFAPFSENPLGAYTEAAVIGYISTVTTVVGAQLFNSHPVGMAAGVAIGLLFGLGGQPDSHIETHELPNGMRIDVTGLGFIDILRDQETGTETVSFRNLFDDEFAVDIHYDADGNVEQIDTNIGGQRVRANADGSVQVGDDITIYEPDAQEVWDALDNQAEALNEDLPENVTFDDFLLDTDAINERVQVASNSGAATIADDNISIVTDGEGNVRIRTDNTMYDRRDDGTTRFVHTNPETGRVSGVIADPDGSVTFFDEDGNIYEGDPTTWPEDVRERFNEFVRQANDDVVEALNNFVEENPDVEEADVPTLLQGVIDSIFDIAGAIGQAVYDLADWLNDAWESFADGVREISPLVLDLDMDRQIELVSLENSQVYWDIDQDGFGEHSGWVGADDGLLVIDLNSNGAIDDHSELFGTADTDGFSVLRLYDTNSDNVINFRRAANDNVINHKKLAA